MKEAFKKLLWMPYLMAAPVLAEIEKPAKPEGVPEDSLADMITRISNAILVILGVVAVLFIIVGGIQYVASAGNPEQVGKAKNTILYGVIGIVFAILAWAIVGFVISRLG